MRRFRSRFLNQNHFFCAVFPNSVKQIINILVDMNIKMWKFFSKDSSSNLSKSSF